MFKSESGPQTSWRQINVTDEWFSSINLPLSEESIVPYSPNIMQSAYFNTSIVSASDMTTVSALLALTASNKASIPAIEHALASIFADALSRTGAWRFLNITLPITDKKPRLTTYHNRAPNFQYQLLHGGEAY
ncbi:hypothetical protein E8E12_009690 [Didymella heteroderae]|uniref:Uncharacterized protein n=1 Tax=Didymella heteroderae TaxID=1769908 RepID=A0A9P4WYZ2_9PLEO|nr:hypothetical protein E8E12_009690 [Didymella heteroderae]